MAGRVQIDRSINFANKPLRMGKDAMVQGRFNNSYVTFEDDFLQDTLNGDFYGSAVAYGGVAPVIAVAANGTATIAVNTNDNDVAEWYGEANWYAQQEAVLEVRFNVNAITTVAYNVGWVNAASNTNDKIAVQLATTTFSAGANVTDFAGFVFDTDATADTIRCVGTADGTNFTTVDTGLEPTAGTYEVVAVHLDTAGGARFYRNGATVGYVPAAVTATQALRFYIALKGNDIAARLLTVDYIKAWQRRPESSSVIW